MMRCKDQPPMRVELVITDTPANYDTYAPELLKLCLKYYQDPEFEKAFQEWKKEQAEKEGRTA